MKIEDKKDLKQIYFRELYPKLTSASMTSCGGVSKNEHQLRTSYTYFS